MRKSCRLQTLYGILPFFTESAPRPSQSISHNVCLVFVCLSLPGNFASGWTGDFWLMSVLLILSN